LPYTLIWEFEVRDAKRAAFVRDYGPAGPWARLFAQAPGYLGTRLLADLDRPARFVTIDQWQSAAHHAAFKARLHAEYAALDAQCEGLTTHEASLGAFDEHLALSADSSKHGGPTP
jgi:quinol monooxygenase YgiN